VVLGVCGGRIELGCVFLFQCIIIPQLPLFTVSSFVGLGFEVEG
jgi:hypothetical protein